jgi:hypothetical protein
MENAQTAQARYDKLSLWLLIFAFNYAFFHILPAFLNYEIKNKFMVADLFDLLTPFVMIFLTYQIYRILVSDAVENSNSYARSSVVVILILGMITFVEGHGMHLSANAIARHLTPPSPLFALDYFFDETLGHILWDNGIILLSIGLVLIGFSFSPERLSIGKPILIILASLFYGFTYFVNAVEGQTFIFTFPLAVILPLGILWLMRQRRSSLLRNPVLSFYFFAYILACCLFIIWGIWHHGFPEFSELGWI